MTDSFDKSQLRFSSRASFAPGQFCLSSDGEFFKDCGDVYGFTNADFAKWVRECACIHPINDIFGKVTPDLSREEKAQRCKLATACRLMDRMKLSPKGYRQNTITVRLNENPNYFLMNPFGLQLHKVDATQTVKTDIKAENIVVRKEWPNKFTLDSDLFLPHAMIYYYRDDIKCIIQVNHKSVVAVSALKPGLLPLSESAAVLGKVKHFWPKSALAYEDDCDEFACDTLGIDSNVILVANVGAYCCGVTVEEAFYYAHQLVEACKLQLLHPELVILSENRQNLILINSQRPKRDAYDNEYALGEFEFEQMARDLDELGFRTGYEYKRKFYNIPFNVFDETKDKKESEFNPEKAFDPHVSGEWQFNAFNGHSSTAYPIEHTTINESVHVDEGIEENHTQKLYETLKTEQLKEDSVKIAGKESNVNEAKVSTLDDTIENNQIEPDMNENSIGNVDECDANLTFVEFEADITVTEALEAITSLFENEENLSLSEHASSESSDTNLFIEILSAVQDNKKLKQDQNLNEVVELFEKNEQPVNSADKLTCENTALDVSGGSFARDITLEIADDAQIADEVMPNLDDSVASTISYQSDDERIDEEVASKSKTQESSNTPSKLTNGDKFPQKQVNFDSNIYDKAAFTKKGLISLEEIDESLEENVEIDFKNGKVANPFEKNRKGRKTDTITIEDVSNELPEDERMAKMEEICMNEWKKANPEAIDESPEKLIVNSESTNTKLYRTKSFKNLCAIFPSLPRKSPRKSKSPRTPKRSKTPKTPGQVRFLLPLKDDTKSSTPNFEKEDTSESSEYITASEITPDTQNGETQENKAGEKNEELSTSRPEYQRSLSSESDKLAYSKLEEYAMEEQLLDECEAEIQKEEVMKNLEVLHKSNIEISTPVKINVGSTEVSLLDCDDKQNTQSETSHEQQILEEPTVPKNNAKTQFDGFESITNAHEDVNQVELPNAEELSEAIQMQTNKNEELSIEDSVNEEFESNLNDVTEKQSSQQEEVIDTPIEQSEKTQDISNQSSNASSFFRVERSHIIVGSGELSPNDCFNQEKLESINEDARINDSGILKDKLMSIADFYYTAQDASIDSSQKTQDSSPNDSEATTDHSSSDNEKIDDDNELELSLRLAELNAQINESISSGNEKNSDDSEHDEDISYLETEQAIYYLEKETLLDTEQRFEDFEIIAAVNDPFAPAKTYEAETQTDWTESPHKFICFPTQKSAEKFFKTTEHKFNLLDCVFNDKSGDNKVSEEIQATPALITQSVQASPKEAPKEKIKAQSQKFYRTTAFYGYNLPLTTQPLNNFALFKVPTSRWASMPTVSHNTSDDDFCPRILTKKICSLDLCKNLCKSTENVKRKLDFNPPIKSPVDSGVAEDSEHAQKNIQPSLVRSTSLLSRIQKYEEEVKRINSIPKLSPKRTQSVNMS